MLRPGTEFGSFRIAALLGRGGMGEVYEATQTALGRTVALKVLHPSLGEDATFRERFRREGRLQASLEHPNVVTVYEAGERDGRLFLAMRLVRGTTVKRRIAAGAMTPERTLAVMGPVAEALDAAHAIGLVHRDVKPQNILVDEDDRPFLADFGLTRGDLDDGLTATGAFVGTLDYLAPEALRGEPMGAPGDVYAFTCVLHECLTGQVPFARATEGAVVYAHVHEPPPGTRATRPDLPPEVDDVLRRGMAKDPEDRPGSTAEVVAALARALGAAAPEVRSRAAPPVLAVGGGGAVTLAGPAPEPVTSVDAPATLVAPAAARSARPARPWPWLAGGLGAALAAGGVAFALGHQPPHAARAGTVPLSVSASGTAVGLDAPAGWRPVAAESAPAIPGLALTAPVALASPSPGAGVVAGTAAGEGPSLLPSQLRATARGALPAARAVRLGRTQALRYDDVRLRGFDRRLVLWVAPLATRVAVVGCYAAPAATCEQVARTLRLTGERARGLGGDAAAGRRLSALASDLSAARRRGRSALADARRPASQASAARALAATLTALRGEVDAVGGGPAAAPERRALAGALGATAAGYRALAEAADAHRPDTFAAAGRRIAAAERDLRADLGALARRLSIGTGPAR